MKKMFYLLFVPFLLLNSTHILAKGYYSYPENSYRTTGDTHYVRPYVKQDGTYVEGHESGNPGSGIHCHDNVCY